MSMCQPSGKVTQNTMHPLCWDKGVILLYEKTCSPFSTTAEAENCSSFLVSYNTTVIIATNLGFNTPWSLSQIISHIQQAYDMYISAFNVHKLKRHLQTLLPFDCSAVQTHSKRAASAAVQVKRRLLNLASYKNQLVKLMCVCPVQAGNSFKLFHGPIATNRRS